jgi:hypothetical protein
MNFENPQQPEEENSSKEVPDGFFDGSSSLSMVMKRIQNMHEEGLVLQGSSQSYKAVELAKNS